jgi:hypothetical protein
MGVGREANNPTLYKRKLLRSLQEIQPDFCGGGQGLSWAVEPRKEEEEEEEEEEECVKCPSSPYINILLHCCQWRVLLLAFASHTEAAF